jgi:superfamily II DNA/RNA helicase
MSSSYRQSPPAQSGRPSAPGRSRRPAGRPAGGSSQPRQRPEAVSTLDAALTAAQQAPKPTPRSFLELGLPESVVAVLARGDINTPSEIQARTIPDVLAGRDVLGRAQTGSGKTLAFGLPLITRLSADGKTRTPQAPRGLVLVPTRELARQVADAIEEPAKALGLKVTSIFGGASMGPQIAALRSGVDIVVATPGRLMDLMERNAVRLTSVSVAVLDEADHMADLGFLPAVTKILDATPANRQCLLFSATLDRGVDKLVTRYLKDPAIHAAAPAAAQVENMDHQVFRLTAEDKVNVAAEIAVRPARTLFFVRTKHGADRLAKQLTRQGVEAAAIHGNLNQNQRMRALDGFSSGHTRVLVATDVAARGLHVDDLDLVVHYDPPADHKDYLHRSGRTARAGASGTVISFVESHQAREVARMHQSARVDPEIKMVSSGHHAVKAIGASGTPIILTARAPRAAISQRQTSRVDSGMPPRRPGRRRASAPGTSTSTGTAGGARRS